MPKRTHVAELGKRRVKQRRGWSSRNLISSQRENCSGTTFPPIQIMNRSIQGNPVLPMMIKKLPRSRGSTAPWNDIMESGVSVKPRSLKRVAEVNMPLQTS